MGSWVAGTTNVRSVFGQICIVAALFELTYLPQLVKVKIKRRCDRDMEAAKARRKSSLDGLLRTNQTSRDAILLCDSSILFFTRPIVQGQKDRSNKQRLYQNALQQHMRDPIKVVRNPNFRPVWAILKLQKTLISSSVTISTCCSLRTPYRRTITQAPPS